MLDALGKGQDLPANTVSITFDDACRTIYTEAFPRLRKRNWPFTLFVSFERTNRSVRVTTVGEEILRHARRMMEQADAIRSLSAAQRDPLAGPLRPGAIPTINPRGRPGWRVARTGARKSGTHNWRQTPRTTLPSSSATENLQVIRNLRGLSCLCDLI